MLSSWLYKQKGRGKNQVKFAVNFKRKEILLVNSFELCSEEGDCFLLFDTSL